MNDCPWSRIDIIGQNGNDGEVYSENSCMHCGTYLKVPDTWWPSWASTNTKICISCGREQNKKNDSPEKSRSRMLKRKYGITLEEYNTMLEKQNGGCYLCGDTDPGGPPTTKHFCVDHCHSSGDVRKLLCNNCNSGLGFFKDNPDLMRLAANYVEDHYPEVPLRAPEKPVEAANDEEGTDLPDPPLAA